MTTTEPDISFEEWTSRMQALNARLTARREAIEAMVTRVSGLQLPRLLC